VWRWDQAEPFGNNAADENPSGLGSFDLPLRLPGQRHDAETGLHYNYFRDYDPSIGRYSESDPIGLRGGLNTYAYAHEDPLSRSDPFGLESFVCKRPLGKKPDTGPVGILNPVYHQYSCVFRDGKYVCGGHTSASSSAARSIIKAPGRPTTEEEDYYHPNACTKVRDDNTCFENCMLRNWAEARPSYGVHPGITDCQEYDDDLHYWCANECRGKPGGKDPRFPWERLGSR
jgi:RHS repeat-associated protein